MIYLLDTATFIWIIQSPDKLPKKVKNIYLNEKNDILLSLASMWEITIKYSLKKLSLPEPPNTLIPKACFKNLINTRPITPEDIFEYGHLPYIHKDPFDRMIIAQAIVRDHTIITPDQLIPKYDINTIWE